MHVTTHDTVEQLEAAARRERDGRVRDRVRAVQDWVRWYNEGGLANLPDAARSGQPRKCPKEKFEAVKRRIVEGPRPEDGVCTLRGRDVQRILAEEFGVVQTLSATYELMHTLGLEPLRPRPRHVKNDPAAMEAWLERAPFVRAVRDAHPGKEVEVWFEDEARIGQQGTLTTVWAERGSRPTAVKQTEYQWAYVSAAVNPRTGRALGMITEEMNTPVMNDLLCNLSRMLGEARHAVLVWDGAGFHTSGTLEVPDNITLLPLPPCSPELNCVERIWLWMRGHDLSNRAYDDREHVEHAIAESCARLDPERIRSICRTEWLERID